MTAKRDGAALHHRLTRGQCPTAGGRSNACGPQFMVQSYLSSIIALASPKRPPIGAVGRCPAALPGGAARLVPGWVLSSTVEYPNVTERFESATEASTT